MTKEQMLAWLDDRITDSVRGSQMREKGAAFVANHKGRRNAFQQVRNIVSGHSFQTEELARIEEKIDTLGRLEVGGKIWEQHTS
jgi:hypothetical protein